MTPVIEHHASFTQGIDHFPIQTLGPEPAVEALGITVLPWATRINVDRADRVVLEPLLDDLGDKLRAVVTADELWGSMLLYAFLQNPRHISRRNRPVRVQRMTLTRKLVDQGQYPRF